MIDDSPLGRSVTALHQYFLGDATMSGTLAMVAEAAIVALPQAHFVGITMMVDGEVDTFVFTDPEVLEIDRAQYESGRGPCVDAWKDGEINVIDDTRTETRWPEFCEVAHGHGVLSTMSLPMIAGQKSVGAMNVYALTDHGFGDDDRRTGSVFAAQAAFVLTNAHTYWEARSLGENLSTALESRSVIEQAKGIIIATSAVSADQAFEMLVSQSQYENRKLRDLAAEIVDNASRRRL